jgi:ribulose-phosphate 3-epimerase
MTVDLGSIWDLVPKVDFVQLMSIAEIGEQGHPLDERIFDRIKLCKEKFPSVPVSIDGGVNVTNYKKLLEAGADRLVVGSGFKDLWHLLTNA